MQRLPDPPTRSQRYPTRAAIDALARRFNLPNDPFMQDWEYEVVDPRRLEEFLAAYTSGELDTDERFLAMCMILQSFEDQNADIETHPQWPLLLTLLDTEFDLHHCTICHWSCPDTDDPDDDFRIARHLRPLLAKQGSSQRCRDCPC